MKDDRRKPLLVAATVREAGLFIGHWGPGGKGRWAREARYYRWEGDRNLPFLLAVTGIGPGLSRVGLEQALDDSGEISSVVGFGFAGGLAKSGKRGDLVIPTQVLFEKMSLTPTEWLRMALAARSEASAWRNLITVDQVIESPAEKAALYAATDAEAVDMEAGVWGRVCQERKIPWAVVRAVLDPADQVLPHEFTRIIDGFGHLRLGKTLSLFLSRPSLIRSALRQTGGSLARLAEPQMKLLAGWVRAEK
ncbi:MAG: hypothetical protein V1495_06630 [Pseudomonadota bacterium]